MINAKLTIVIDHKTAIARGKTKYGEHVHVFTEEQLAQLTMYERQFIAYTIAPPAGQLTCLSTEWSDVKHAIAAAAIKYADKIERNHALDRKVDQEREQEIARVMALDTWQTMRPSGQPCLINLPSLRDDKNTHFALRYAREIKERDARDRSWNEERQKQQESNVQRTKKQFRDYALATPALERAAREGYDINAAVISQVCGDISAIDSEYDVRSIPQDQYSEWDWDVRANPSPEAFAVFDRVTAAIEDIRHPDAVVISVKKIMRVETPQSTDYYEQDDSQRIYTGVVVTVTSPLTDDAAVVFAAEEI